MEKHLPFCVRCKVMRHLSSYSFITNKTIAGKTRCFAVPVRKSKDYLLFCMGLEFGFSRVGKKAGLVCSRRECWGKYLDVRKGRAFEEWRKQRNEEIQNVWCYKIFLWRLSQGGLILILTNDIPLCFCNVKCQRIIQRTQPSFCFKKHVCFFLNSLNISC
jgi:hypothetical protein